MNTGAPRGPETAPLQLDVLVQGIQRQPGANAFKPDTAARPRLMQYQTIPTLREYVLVDPETRQVEIYRFGDPAQSEVHTQGSIRLDCLDAEITLDEVYMDAGAL